MKFSRLTFEKTTESETTMTNTIQIQSAQDITNTANVSYYVDKIKNEMTVATGAWRNVAELFAAATNEFGTDSDNFKSLMIQTKFSRSKVTKLVAIANDERLKKNEAKLQCIDAWTVMYEITKLDESEFKKFIKSVSADMFITIKDVNNARVKKTVTVDPYSTVFSIQIDAYAIKAQMFGGDDYQELMDAIETIQNTMNFVRVKETKVFENDTARFYGEVDREFNKQVRKVWNDEKKKLLARTNCKVTKSEVKEEVQATFNEGDYEAAFAYIGSDALDKNDLYNRAISNVYAKREMKFSNQVASPDAYANTEIQVAA